VRSRFPRALYSLGDEPDPRFTFANERTFLAWIRTSLALIVGGVALEVLGLGLQPQLRLAASLVLLVAGAASPLAAWISWLRCERAMRLAVPLPPSLLGPLVVVVSAAGALVTLGLLLR